MRLPDPQQQRRRCRRGNISCQAKQRTTASLASLNSAGLAASSWVPTWAAQAAAAAPWSRLPCSPPIEATQRPSHLDPDLGHDVHGVLGGRALHHGSSHGAPAGKRAPQGGGAGAAGPAEGAVAEGRLVGVEGIDPADGPERGGAVVAVRGQPLLEGQPHGADVVVCGERSKARRMVTGAPGVQPGPGGDPRRTAAGSCGRQVMVPWL